jgi:hypothetical protein
VHSISKLSFANTTAFNARKKGQPNPKQQYFALVATLYARVGADGMLPVAIHRSDPVIVRANTPSMSGGSTPGINVGSAHKAGKLSMPVDNEDDPKTWTTCDGCHLSMTSGGAAPSQLKSRAKEREASAINYRGNVVRAQLEIELCVCGMHFWSPVLATWLEVSQHKHICSNNPIITSLVDVLSLIVAIFLYDPTLQGINVSSPEEALVVHGNIWTTGGVFRPSDCRVKMDLTPVNTAQQLANVKAIQLYEYNLTQSWASTVGRDNDRACVGVIAQELQGIIPEAVKETRTTPVLVDGSVVDNLLVIDYDRLHTEALGALMELAQLSDSLELRLTVARDKTIATLGMLATVHSNRPFQQQPQQQQTQTHGWVVVAAAMAAAAAVGVSQFHLGSFQPTS